MKKLKGLLFAMILVPVLVLFTACGGTCELDHMDDHTCNHSDTTCPVTACPNAEDHDHECDYTEADIAARDAEIAEKNSQLALIREVLSKNLDGYTVLIIDAAQGWEGDNFEYVVNEPGLDLVLQVRIYDETAEEYLSDAEIAALGVEWVIGDDTAFGDEMRVTLPENSTELVGKTLKAYVDGVLVYVAIIAA